MLRGGAAELNFPPKIFIGLIYCNYAAHEHVGGGFAAFGSQVVSLCSESAESDRIDYYALSIHYLRVVEPACIPSSPKPAPGAPPSSARCNTAQHTPSATAHSQRSGLYINMTALTRPLAAGGGVLGALGVSGVVVPVGDVLFGRCARYLRPTRPLSSRGRAV